MDSEQTRIETDARLREYLPLIRNGEAMHLLEPFSKAYLGLYLEIDNSLDPAARIYLLANNEVADAVLEGFSATLQSELPNAEYIGDVAGRENHDPYKYVVLAGIDFLSESASEKIRLLPEQTLITALCYHYISSIQTDSQWVRQVEAEHIEAAATALVVLWVKLAEYDAHHLPGLHRILESNNYCNVADRFIPSLLKEWGFLQSWYP